MSKRFVKKIAAKPASIVAPQAKKSRDDTAKQSKTDDSLPTLKSQILEGISSSTTPVFSLKAECELNSYQMPIQPRPEFIPPLKKVVGMKFTWLSTEEKRKLAGEIVIKSSKSDINPQESAFTVYDPRLGVIVNYKLCPVCGMDWRSCPGHFGIIEFPYPIPHPIRMKQLAEFLTCVCEDCHRLVLSWKQMKILGILEYRKDDRFKAYLDKAKKSARCKHCNRPHGKYSVTDDKFFKTMKKKGETKKWPIEYDKVAEIISNIREKEFQLLGYNDPMCHPKHLILDNLLVLPSCARPFVEGGGSNVQHDDLTCKYIEIIKVVIKLNEKGLAEKSKKDHIDNLFFHVKTMFDNSKNKARDVNGKRAIKAMKQRVSGKSGHVRQNMQGKRNNSCLTGDALVSLPNGLSIRLDQTECISSVLGFSEDVNGLKFDKRTDFLNQGEKECFELVFADGSSLTGTADHLLMDRDGKWLPISELDVDSCVKRTGISPSYNPIEEMKDCSGWTLDVGNYKFSADSLANYERSLAFCRLLGSILSDGSVNNTFTSQINFGTLMDAQTALEDIFMLTGKRPCIGNCEARGQNSGKTFRIDLPSSFCKWLEPIKSKLPNFLIDPKCPLGCIREFLGGLFGANCCILSVGIVGAFYHKNIIKLLERCEVTDVIITSELQHLYIYDFLTFVKKVGFRYCIEKQTRAGVIASYLSMQKLRCGTCVPSFKKFLTSLGISKWFTRYSYICDRTACYIPTFSMPIISKKSVGIKRVYDITIDNTHAFAANGIIVHNCARSVISPNPDMHVCEVGIPQEIADKLTFPERVNEINLAWCQELVDTDRVVHVKRGNEYINMARAIWTRGFKLIRGDIVIRAGQQIIPESYHSFKIEDDDEVLRTERIQLEDGTTQTKKQLIKGVEPPKRRGFKLRIGDEIERKLQNGDWTLLNRQPTLHESSIKAKRIRIVKERTIQMDLSNTASFGADFDGDEMNAFIAQCHQTRSEMQFLMSTDVHFISSADSRPVLEIKQDAMVAGYLFTLGRVPIDKDDFYDACCAVDEWVDVSMRSQRSCLLGYDVVEKMEHVRNVYKWISTSEMLKRAKIERVVKRRYGAKDKFPGSIVPNDDSDRLFTGHGMLSMILPNDFEFTLDTKLSPDKEPLRITRGVFVSGTINKDAIHRIIHHLYKDYGGAFGCDFVTYYQRIMHLLIRRRGFSVGLEDCTPVETETISQERTKCFLQAKSIMETEPDLELREAKILAVLNKAIDIGDRIVKQSLAPNNNFMHMIISGAKGKLFNYVNSVNSVGQQNLEGRRAPKNYGGRSLPCFIGTPGSQYAPDVIPENNVLSEVENLTRLFQSRAFVVSSFYSGLTAPEFFFLAAGGREGLIDTSVRTAKCGYLSRRLLKRMEDLKIGYNSSVINAKGTIVQFCYGDDNFSAAELIKTENYGIQCTDIEHLAARLNGDYEYEQFEATLPKKIPKIIEESEDNMLLEVY